MARVGLTEREISNEHEGNQGSQATVADQGTGTHLLTKQRNYRRQYPERVGLLVFVLIGHYLRKRKPALFTAHTSFCQKEASHLGGVVSNPTVTTPTALRVQLPGGLRLQRLQNGRRNQSGAGCGRWRVRVAENTNSGKRRFSSNTGITIARLVWIEVRRKIATMI